MGVAHPVIHHYNFSPMEQPFVDMVMLQRRDSAAWSALLSAKPDLANVVVSAVNSQQVQNPYLLRPGRFTQESSRQVRRYTLALEGYSDPITFIAKQSNTTEASVYGLANYRPSSILPTCWYINRSIDRSWLILEDIPDDLTPDRRTPEDIDNLIEALAAGHTETWLQEPEQGADDQPVYPAGIDHFIDGDSMPYSWKELKQQHAVLFEQGPGALLSEHAIRNAGRLAPALLQAANGLVIMRDLGGWPGVLGESHLAAAADLLDDPVPMLNALNTLPVSLLHGSPHPYHWRMTLFNDRYLIDWSEAKWGPGIMDLVEFIEHYPVLFGHQNQDAPSIWRKEPQQPFVRVRELTPLVEETLIDTYMLAMSAGLGARFSARSFRSGLAAARCLHVLTTWFVNFSTWFANMPDRYVWQRINRVSDHEVAAHVLGPIAGMRPHLAGVFERFLRAYHNL